jgi:predicted RNA-binding protein
MCQAAIYLNGEETMREMTLVEIPPESVRPTAFFETPVVVPAVLHKVYLLKHDVILESIRKGEPSYERN